MDRRVGVVGQGKNSTARTDEPHSAKAEDKRRQDNNRKQGKKSGKRMPHRRGRVSTADKIKLAARTEQIFPQGVEPNECRLSHTRVAWRLENGRAVLIAYEIYRYRITFGIPTGIIGRSEFGVEIMVAIGYQVYCMRLSIDMACAILVAFFEQLKLRKSQADAMLNQHTRAWEAEFDALCTLLVNSVAVYTDETSWSINSI